MSSYYGFPGQNAQFASYMAAAAAAGQTTGLSGQNSGQTYQVAYPAPNQYNPQYTAMYSAAPIKTVTVVTSTSAIKPVSRAQGLYSNFVQAGQAPTSTNNGYDAALLSAASNFTSGSNNDYKYGYGSSSRGGKPPRGTFWGGSKRGGSAAGSSAARSQIYYCECCKISCAGPQTWQEHIAGSKHKKREAALQAGKEAVPPSARPGASFLKCAVCEITVTGSDAFVAHVNGAKHQKTIKVYQQMGKPVPSSEPVVVTPAQAAQTNITTAEKQGTASKKLIPNVHGKGNTVLGTAKVAFVPAGQLHTIGNNTEEITSTTDTATTTAMPLNTTVAEEPTAQSRAPATGVLYLPNERDVAPVGAEYVEEIVSDFGKVVSFKCKLCDCSFNDLFAKEMHLKGRRHRLAYKQKVDPSLNVEMKGNSYKNKRANARGTVMNRGYYHGGPMPGPGGLPRHSPGFEPYYAAPGSRIRPLFTPKQQSFGASEMDDRYVLSKHTIVYASQLELQAIQKLVLRLEGALKMASDKLLEEEVARERERQESELKSGESATFKWTPNQSQIQSMRHLRGVQRCGPLAKGLLIRGDTCVELAVMCLDKPTITLLGKVAAALPSTLEKCVTSNSEIPAGHGNVELGDFSVTPVPEEGLILVSTLAKFPANTPQSAEDANNNNISDTNSPSQIAQRRFECRVYITSPAVSDDPADAASDPSDMLPRSRCLDALAILRHAKFFQAKISPNTEAMVALRIIRDLCRRVPTWNPFPPWALELLVEKCAATAAISLTAAQLLRRVFECLAAGILLPGGPGIADPCERLPTDAAAALNEQQREDITASAQHALRLVAFGLIWKVMGVERIIPMTDCCQSPSFRSGTKRKAMDDPSPIGAKSAAVSLPNADSMVMG